MTDSPVDAGVLTHGAEEVLPEGRLGEQLAEGKPLRVKFGIDPTAPDIHLGHVVPLAKLAQFQDAGHTVILIIGDYTARIGDPSGRDTRRPVLQQGEIEANAKTFQDQAFKVLDPKRTEVRFNSEWLEMPPEQLFGLIGRVTVAQLLAREDFRKRMEEGRPLSVLELLYPIMQGYDSVAVEADVEIGGTDQKFNLLLGREIQQALGQKGQSIMTLPILPGTDGERRMSKSFDNYVGVTEPPEEIFGKLMSIPDEAMPVYYRLLLGKEQAADAKPVEAKRELARRLVERFHDAAAAKAAEEHFDQVHVQREVPDEIPEVGLGQLEGQNGAGQGEVHLPALIAGAFEISSSEARRLLGQGGVKLDGESVGGERLDLPRTELEGKVLQVGKRRFARLVG